MRTSIEIHLWADFANVKDLVAFADQQIPPALVQRDSESLEAWRDRLYHQFRIPSVLAALSDLKTSYVGAALFKSIVRGKNPQLEFAKFAAIEPPKNILRSRQAVAILREELSSPHAQALIPEHVLQYILPRLQPVSRSTQWKRTIENALRRRLPTWVKSGAKRVTGTTALSMDVYVLAFRAYIISRMSQMLMQPMVSEPPVRSATAEGGRSSTR